ncbi:uroporphyrinogen-III synthase [Variovorax sp. PCZ-1]|uniref:uroporphyrinogen-III synthase n=1 Tax=Variovorax sp. PCZ-1 TaxID=2835533 RepID=UPI001BCD1883|nr:uroporphyrinogen-III synthase [Variovorax sp. PCZ-1]MBS7805976.1 uroporphyrinogen-III synthase [Variovorax sp. PCZ-1]
MAHLIVTRPADQAAPWLKVLRDMGHVAVALPLIEIAPVESEDDAQALELAWARLKSFDALMFVSSSAAQAFFKPNRPFAGVESAQRAIDLIVNKYPNIRLWATGQGTVASLRSLGIPAHRIDAPSAQAGQFDSEALWQVVQDQIRGASRVLILRGRDVGLFDSSRDWLAQQIMARGGVPTKLVVYERRAPKWSLAQTAQCSAWLRDGSIWLLSSSQALRNLPASLDARQGICICTHERIAQAAKERGFAVVCTSRPTLQDVAASIKSLNERSSA